ncbi:MAG: autotransporter-associated beta strand repeat-containing protein [Agitococcus sp.]
MTGVISGTGSLVKDGAGQLNLTGANSYAGGTQVNAGKVALDANTALGVGSATFAKDTELKLSILRASRLPMLLKLMVKLTFIVAALTAV